MFLGFTFLHSLTSLLMALIRLSNISRRGAEVEPLSLLAKCALEGCGWLAAGASAAITRRQGGISSAMKGAVAAKERPRIKFNHADAI